MKRVVLFLLIIVTCCALAVFASAETTDSESAVLDFGTGGETEAAQTEATQSTSESDYTPVDVSAYGEAVESWDISKTEGVDKVTATLYNDPERIGYYVLVIEGVGAMKDFTYSGSLPSNAPWFVSYGALIKELRVGEGVTTVGAYLLLCNNISNLLKVELPDSIVSIGNSAFYNCYNLTSFRVGPNVTAIGNSAFSGCRKLVEICNESELPISSSSSTSYGYIRNYALNVYTPTSGSSFVFTVDDYIFIKGNTLNEGEVYYLVGYLGDDKELTLPKGISGEKYEMYSFAFWKNTDIESVVFSDDVISIGASSFADCHNLKSLYFSESLTVIGDNSFDTCGGLTSVVLPEGLIGIGRYSFRNCRNLKSISIPDTIEIIDLCAFQHCNVLETTEYNNALYIGNSNNPYLVLVSSADRNIESCVVHNDTRIMLGQCFYECTALKDVSIGKSVVYIGDSSFDYCYALESVRLYAEHAKRSTSGLNSQYSLFKYAGKNSDGITVYIYPSVKAIGIGLFRSGSSGQPNITRAVFEEGSSCELIDKNAFYNCIYLENIELPDSVKNIKNGAFQGCTSLKEVSIGKGTYFIDNGVFGSCPSIALVRLENYDLIATMDSNHSAGGLCNYATTLIMPIDVGAVGNYITSNYTYQGIINCVRFNETARDYTVYSKHDHSLDSNWRDVALEPTLKSAGVYGEKCVVCGLINGTAFPALDNSAYIFEYVPQECEDEGYQNYYIRVNETNYCFTIIIPALGHHWSDWEITAEATYSECGERERICANDASHVEVEAIDKLVAVVLPEVTDEGISGVTLGTDNVTVIPEDNNVVISSESGDLSVNSSEAGLTAELVSKLAGKNLSYTSDIGKILLNSITTEKLAAFGKQIDITLTDITVAEELEKGKIAFSIKITADGEDVLPCGADGNGTITLSFAYKTGLHKDFVKVIYRAENGERQEVNVTDYDPKTGVVTFETNHLSDYEIYGIELPELSGMYLNLTESINVFYTADIPNGFENPYMIFSLLGEEYVVTEYNVRADGKYAFRFANVLPQYMGEKITAVLYAEMGDVPYSVTNSNMSILSYCEYALDAYSTDIALIELLSDLLTFGAKAQLYTGYNTNALVTDGLALAPTEFIKPLDAFTLNGDVSEIVDWVGFGLNFTGTVNSYFTLKADNADGIVVKITINGRTVSYNLADLTPSGEGKYRIYLRGIMAYEMDDVISATFEYNGEQIGRTLTYSVKTYACYLDAISASDELVALIESMCNYGCSAYNYFYKGADRQ